MINVHKILEQSNQETQGQIERKSNLDTDLYSTGYFEGYIGCEPSQPEQHGYWEGYQIGAREYWAKKLGVKIPTEL